MSDEIANIPGYFPEETENTALPSSLNVLTILTLIGSVIGVMSAIYSYFTICKSAEKLANQEMPEMGETLSGIMESAIELSIKQCDSKLLILLATVIPCILCILGAIQMRKLQKQGFFIYLVGEIIGPIAMMFILGKSFGGMMLAFGLIIPIIFIILYATQQKYLVR